MPHWERLSHIRNRAIMLGQDEPGLIIVSLLEFYWVTLNHETFSFLVLLAPALLERTITGSRGNLMPYPHCFRSIESICSPLLSL